MSMLETKSVGIVDENAEENELVLELSIGGIFGKTNGNNGRESVEKEVPAVAVEALNVQSKREIQAFRRRELRRKREEKLKKSVGFGSCGSVSGPFVESKEWLDEVLEIEPARKKERIGNLPENIGLIPAAAPLTNGFVNHNVMQVTSGGEGQVVRRIDESVNTKSSVFRPTVCRSFRPYQGSRNLKAIEDEIEGNGRRNGNVNSSGSGGCGSSAFSDSQCSSRQGGATDDSRSNSSNSQLDQQLPNTSVASDPSDSSKPTVSTNKLTDSTVCEPGPLKPNDQSNLPGSNISNPPSKLDFATQQASFLSRMPCVSTTGNGPNGKTVSGFLYRYTKNEVSIVCVCHGQSFSPAGFVEHAGGVDIIHPLKHITIFPTAFA
ncbi:hypothetical protein Ccrd_003723 [Cynara cardunculus var. scolymus]|uniref:Ninja-family protein n=2 Tax=Cynara cardunculus var. scolymus TaxID=59895 RepID=A0A103XP26_CYNCS|nr:hypothetical protein Ccrd_003723 [Cynara cardunculus var. scolymus]